MDSTTWVWNMKGYIGVQLTKEKLQNKKYSFEEIENSEPGILKKIENNLEKGGIVFGISKKKTIKALYFFKLTKNEKESILIFDKKVILEEANKHIKGFENDFDKILGYAIFERHDIDKALWKEKEVTRKEKFKSTTTTIKTFSWLGIIMFSIMSIATIVCSTSYSFLVSSNYTIEEIKNDESIINYITDINDYNYNETIEIISEFEDNVEFTVSEIIIPTLIILFEYILLIISLKEVLELVKNVTDNKSLFTTEKNRLLKKIIIKVYVALLFVLDDFILWLGLGTILEIIQYIFNYCVQLTNNEK